MRPMDSIAQDSGSRILHVLQPMLYLKEPLSVKERSMLDMYEEMINYSVQGYLRMSPGLQEMTRGSNFARYLDLSAPFQGDPETYFFDYVHINAAGYRIVSARIADVIAEMLELQSKELRQSPARLRRRRRPSAGPRSRSARRLTP